MRAGKLDRTIVIERNADTVDEYGAPAFAWTAVATLRAEIVEATTDELMRSGVVDQTATTFRTRWLADVTNADRVVYGGKPFNITATSEVGRRKGLVIRCTAATKG